MKYFKILELIQDYAPSLNRDSCIRLLKEEQRRICLSPGSSNNHHTWEGGYLDHLIQTIEIAGCIFRPLSQYNSLPFSLEDVFMCLYLHDIEKPWKYIPECVSSDLNNIDLSTKDKRREFRNLIISKYGFQLTPEQLNGIEYAEGEFDYSPRQRKMGRLAAFVHMCDVWSARGLFDVNTNCYPI